MILNQQAGSYPTCLWSVNIRLFNVHGGRHMMESPDASAINPGCFRKYHHIPKDLFIKYIEMVLLNGRQITRS